MRILILGGTRFVGRHIVDSALANGHEVTLFNRGQSNPDLYPQVEQLVGDRDGDLTALVGGTWDAAIDTCGYLPRLVRDSAQLLQNVVQRYLFISSISVYADFAAPVREESALATIPDPTIEEITEGSYGALKALCEAEVQAAYGARATIVRPGYIVGPHDYTDRFTYWIRRLGQGGHMAVPGPPTGPVQFIDGRDLGIFCVHLLESDQEGIYHGTGPVHPITWAEFMQAGIDTLQVDTTVTWLPPEFLATQELPATAFPIWAPAAYEGAMQATVAAAVGAGLRLRPLAELIRDTWTWDQEEGEAKMGLSPAAERQLLADFEGH